MLVMEQEDSVGGRMTVEVASGPYAAAPAEMGERSLQQIPILQPRMRGEPVSRMMDTPTLRWGAGSNDGGIPRRLAGNTTMW